MNIETIILILFFFIFPIVRQILESRKQREAPPPAEADEALPEERPRRVRMPAPVDARPVRRTPGDEGWAASWGRWSDAESAEAPGEEQSVEAEAPVLVATRTREPDPIETRGERTVLLRDRAPRAESLDLDRVAEVEERRRNRARTVSVPIAAPARIPALRIGPTSIVAPRAAVTGSPSPAAEHPRLAWLGGGSPEQLRRMVVISEILGPPRVEREFD